jgi:16S rRNA (cytosine1407-C5)-methyltransferase
MSKKKKHQPGSLSENNFMERALERYQPLLDAENYSKLMDEVKQPLLPTIRINLLKDDPTKLTERMQKMYGWEFEPIPFCPSGFRVKPGQQALSNSIEHRMGDFYIQEAASMLPAELFDMAENPHPIVLDMAASPGGKTIHLADRINDLGVIIANDSSRSRITALQIVLEKWGVINQAVTCMHGELFGELFPEVFDLVLLDAPCSMEGLRTTASHPMRSISDKERQRLAQRQLKLLESALFATRVGGQIVYSTCTLAPEEDESVLDALLGKYPNTFQIDLLRQRLPFSADGLISDGKTQYPDEVSHSIRLWPYICHTAGFFAARLTKKEEIHNHIKPQPFRSKRNEFAIINEKELKSICRLFWEEYGFDLKILFEEQDATLWKINDELRLISNQFLKEFSQLPLISSGLRIGRLVESGFSLSHEFAARFGMQFQTGIILLPDEQLPNWLRGEDIRNFSSNEFSKGKIVIVTDQYGRNLGRGKVQAAQLKNLLPNRLF